MQPIRTKLSEELGKLNWAIATSVISKKGKLVPDDLVDDIDTSLSTAEMIEFINKSLPSTQTDIKTDEHTVAVSRQNALNLQDLVTPTEDQAPGNKTLDETCLDSVDDFVHKKHKQKWSRPGTKKVHVQEPLEPNIDHGKADTNSGPMATAEYDTRVDSNPQESSVKEDSKSHNTHRLSIRVIVLLAIMFGLLGSLLFLNRVEAQELLHAIYGKITSLLGFK